MGLFDTFRRLLGGGRASEEEWVPTPRSKREAQRLARESARPQPRPRRVTRIRRSVIGLICESGKGSHPNEFGAALRAEGDTVTELILVPGMLGGDKHAIMPLGYLPVDSSLVGTVHSHPGPHAIPSYADEELFRNFGHTHIIIAEPYTPNTWIAYDQSAQEIELEVVED